MKKLLPAIRFLFRKRLSIKPETIETQIKDYHFTISPLVANNYTEVVSNNSKYRDRVQELDRAKIRAAIHPLYLTKISWHLVNNLNDFLEQPIDQNLLNTLVHLSDHFEYHDYLEYDKEYRVESRLCLIEPHKKGTRLTIRLDYYQSDRLVAVEHTTGLLFGVKCIGKGMQVGQLPIKDKVDERLCWSKVISIDNNLPYDYAEKAVIDAPIHTNPKFAKSIGLPDIILQGTCTFAKAVTLILAEPSLFNGEPPPFIKRLTVNFTGMLLTPNEITVRVLFNADNRIVFDVLNTKGEAIIKGGNIVFDTTKEQPQHE